MGFSLRFESGDKIKGCTTGSGGWQSRFAFTTGRGVEQWMMRNLKYLVIWGKERRCVALGDKSSPEEIYRQLQMSRRISKKKQSGGLYKDSLSVYPIMKFNTWSSLVMMNFSNLAMSIVFCYWTGDAVEEGIQFKKILMLNSLSPNSFICLNSGCLASKSFKFHIAGLTVNPESQT